LVFGISGRYCCPRFWISTCCLVSSVHFCSLIIRESCVLSDTDQCNHIATWGFLLSRLICRWYFSKNTFRKLEVFPSSGDRVGISSSSGSNKITRNRCLAVRPVMENSCFCRISRSRYPFNLSPGDRNIQLKRLLLLGIPDDGQVRKPSVLRHCQNPAECCHSCKSKGKAEFHLITMQAQRVSRGIVVLFH
jgi:hypothetical protein